MCRWRKVEFIKKQWSILNWFHALNASEFDMNLICERLSCVRNYEIEFVRDEWNEKEFVSGYMLIWRTFKWQQIKIVLLIKYCRKRENRNIQWIWTNVSICNTLHHHPPPTCNTVHAWKSFIINARLIL